MESVEEAWDKARVENGINDTPETRKAFYRGGCHAMEIMVEAHSNQDYVAMTTLNSELCEFGQALFEIKSLENKH